MRNKERNVFYDFLSSYYKKLTLSWHIAGIDIKPFYIINPLTPIQFWHKLKILNPMHWHALMYKYILWHIIFAQNYKTLSYFTDIMVIWHSLVSPADAVAITGVPPLDTATSHTPSLWPTYSRTIRQDTESFLKLDTILDVCTRSLFAAFTFCELWPPARNMIFSLGTFKNIIHRTNYLKANKKNLNSLEISRHLNICNNNIHQIREKGKYHTATSCCNWLAMDIHLSQSWAPVYSNLTCLYTFFFPP